MQENCRLQIALSHCRWPVVRVISPCRLPIVLLRAHRAYVLYVDAPSDPWIRSSRPRKIYNENQTMSWLFRVRVPIVTPCLFPWEGNHIVVRLTFFYVRLSYYAYIAIINDRKEFSNFFVHWRLIKIENFLVHVIY